MNKRRLITSGGVARRLMLRGHVCIDVCPQRQDKTKSCFVFYKDRWLSADIDEIMQSPEKRDIPVIEKRLNEVGMTMQEYRRAIFEEYLSGSDGVGA